ncbi:O-Glycosyl hydrolases family 17 protein [Actinidia rufa]|uniref:O-Glycosyl hydrolases family 17 protein n=1 Tax=Actinidia rufa TaxID=165716 RepID=A0A7J0FJ46_9ERIC|nr:O-Glycosyl hydrolases family 17 protein [Actinidia rufa]
MIVGEVGWPTDGDINANKDNARRFDQGLINCIMQGQGTPKCTSPPDIYVFALIDEDAKSIQPGISSDTGCVRLRWQWCIMAPEASVSDRNLPNMIDYACIYEDCTSLGYGSSCSGLDVRSNASYAFKERSM